MRVQNREIDRKKKTVRIKGELTRLGTSQDNYVLTILHVNILTRINLFSVLLTSFFKQGNTGLRLDGIIILPTIGKRKRIFRPFAQIYLFSITCGLWEAGKQQW